MAAFAFRVCNIVMLGVSMWSLPFAARAVQITNSAHIRVGLPAYVSQCLSWVVAE